MVRTAATAAAVPPPPFKLHGCEPAAVRDVGTVDVRAGSLSAFVEVDVLVYAKRWEVELARFNGVTQTFPLSHNVITAHAVTPETASMACK